MLSKIAVVDIDGVLNDYPLTFIDYCKNVGYEVETLTEIKQKLTYSEYLQVKADYRSSDFKHACKPKKDAVELLNALHSKGYLVFIITARQLFEGTQLLQTINWLKVNDLKYDYIYCSAKKDFTVLERLKHADIVIDDNADNIDRIANINGKAKYYHVLNKDNADRISEVATRVWSLNEIISEVENEA